MLLRGELHAILGVETQNIPQLEIRAIYSGRLEFFATKDFLRTVQKRLSRKTLRPRDLTGITVFTDSHAHTRQGIGIPMALADVGFDNLGQFEITSFEAAINLASMGLGIAVIPDRNAETAVNSGSIVPMKIEGLRSSTSLEYRICLSTLRNSPYQEAIHALYLQLQSVLGKGPI